MKYFFLSVFFLIFFAFNANAESIYSDVSCGSGNFGIPTAETALIYVQTTGVQTIATTTFTTSGVKLATIRIYGASDVSFTTPLWSTGISLVNGLNTINPNLNVSAQEGVIFTFSASSTGTNMNYRLCMSNASNYFDSTPRFAFSSANVLTGYNTFYWLYGNVLGEFEDDCPECETCEECSLIGQVCSSTAPMYYNQVRSCKEIYASSTGDIAGVEYTYTSLPLTAPLFIFFFLLFLFIVFKVFRARIKTF